MDESILSLPFLRPGVLVQCANCGEKAADVYAVDEEAALAGQGVCAKCAPQVQAEPGQALLELDVGLAVSAVEAVAEEISAQVGVEEDPEPADEAQVAELPEPESAEAFSDAAAVEGEPGTEPEPEGEPAGEVAGEPAETGES